MRIEELKEFEKLMKEYLLGLNDEHKEEHYRTDYDLAEIELNHFISWLEQRLK